MGLLRVGEPLRGYDCEECFRGDDLMGSSLLYVSGVIVAVEEFWGIVFVAHYGRLMRDINYLVVIY